jgi:tmRNA-binding protein
MVGCVVVSCTAAIVLLSQSYVEAISMEVMGDNADVYAENQRSDRTAADLARAQALLAEREVELHKLHKMCVAVAL